MTGRSPRLFVKGLWENKRKKSKLNYTKMLMGVLYLDKMSPHFDMKDNFLFEMIKVQKI